ncbi:MAG: hypothetical protein EOP33_03695 [Rickettsiaceae bacterium]|nr:MAG: hypothetical protein EOP33_03695 [Rickettsiaceae bacterium]
MGFLFIQVIAILIFINTSLAEKFSRRDVDNLSKQFDITFSIDNHLLSSQNIGTDVALSLINGLAFLSDSKDINGNPLYRILTAYGTYFTVLWNHEISGHALRTKEFKGKVTGFTMTGLFSAATHHKRRPEDHAQKSAIISLGGNEASYMLSKKIAAGLISKQQVIDPVTASAYIFSSGNQAFYVYAMRGNLRGHDLTSYVNNMTKMYGKNSTSMSKIKSLGILDFFDPILATSIYSLFTGNDAKLPMLNLTDDIGLIPSARMVLTPYGVIEKRLIANFITEQANVKATIGFGKEQKSIISVINSNDQKHKVVGGFYGSTTENTKKRNTYFAELSINQVSLTKNTEIGITTAYWKQPELLVNTPYSAKLKNGYMIAINSKYQIRDDLNIFTDVGFKNKGFVIGQHIKKTPLLRVGFNWTL